MNLISRKLLTALFPVSAVAALSLLIAPAAVGQMGGGGGDYGSYLYDKYLEEEAARERQASAETQQPRSGQSVVVGTSEFGGGTSTAQVKTRRFLYRVSPEQQQHYRGR